MRDVNISKNKLKEAAKLRLKKYRDENGLFAAEGFKALEEILSAEIKILEAYALKEIENFKINAPLYIVNEAEMKKICQSESACPVLVIAEKRKEDLESFKKLGRLALLDSVSDPGNLGTIIRSAAAFGIEGLILYGNCTDLYSSKVIRSAAGNFFKVPIIHIKTADEFEKHFKNHLKISLSLSKENNISLASAAEIKNVLLMFGTEASGLSSDLLNLSDKNIKLEMQNNTESLNLAVCASIIFYELSAKSSVR